MMTDAHLTKSVLHDIATHAFALAMGLQNAAPAELGKVSSPSIQYLFSVSRALEEASQEVDKLLSDAEGP